jgi:integrase/recombinase XerD
MAFHDMFLSDRLRALGQLSPIAPHIEAFLAHLLAVGYTPASVKDAVRGALEFGVYLNRRRMHDLRTLTWSHVDAFVATQPRRKRSGRRAYPLSRGVRGSRHLYRWAQGEGIVPPDPIPAAPRYAALLEEWLAFLDRHRGLAPKSLQLYAGRLRPFLEFIGPGATVPTLRRLEPIRIQQYVRVAAPRYSRHERKAMFDVLRRFLQYAWQHGYMPRDLSSAVMRPPVYQHERLPRGPSWADAQRLLGETDNSTPAGCRDLAILQLLLSYGIRRQQVCRLRLEDIHWRRETISFSPMKRGNPVKAPLLASVGDAIADYLRRARPPSETRRVFLTASAPIRPLSPQGLTEVVKRAFDRAKVTSPRPGPHALRHAWATRLQAEGQPLKVIADLLGHRSIETTRIYAKVNFTQLRTVGLSWPNGSPA